MNTHRMSTLNHSTLARKRKISWTAIAAGVITGISMQLILNLLGIGLGFLTISFDSTHLLKMGPLSITWLVLTGIASMFIGGWTGGNLTYNSMKVDNILYGLVIWGLSTMIVFFITLSAAGMLFNNVIYVAERSLSTLSQSVASVVQKSVPGIAEVTKNTLPNMNELQTKIKMQAHSLLKRSSSSEDQQEQQEIKNQLNDIVITLLNAENESDLAQAKEKAVTFLSEKMGISADKANENINKWLKEYNKLSDQVKSKVEDAKRNVSDATEKLADAVGKVSLILALGFICSAIAAMIGTLYGSSRFRDNR